MGMFPRRSHPPPAPYFPSSLSPRLVRCLAVVMMVFSVHCPFELQRALFTAESGSQFVSRTVQTVKHTHTLRSLLESALLFFPVFSTNSKSSSLGLQSGATLQ